MPSAAYVATRSEEQYDADIAYNRAWKAKRVREARRIVAEAKDVPCLDCGGSFPACAMDFDHAGSDKTACIGRMVHQGGSLLRLRAEMAKCEIVCANCHRIRTFT